ncbi:unannotated protein [freshwater metagenome]|uniref:Unannotated protein n=1 Tax=freshwater metagenome TaxID=449393 RepID=A0A6J7DCU3_9ZZZZ
MALDQLVLGDQRFGLAAQREHVDRVCERDHLDISARDRAGEVRGDALAHRARLADVEDLAVGSDEEIDAGFVWKRAPTLGQAVLALLLGGAVGGGSHPVEDTGARRGRQAPRKGSSAARTVSGIGVFFQVFASTQT